MRLEQSLAQVAAFTPDDFSGIRRHIPEEWIEQALQATGTASVRRRRLPAVQVVWMVIGMALFRNRAIVEIVDKLDLALPGRSPTVAASAVPKARARVGAEPLAWLFSRCGDAWGHASADARRWRGLAMYGLDGSTLRVADSPANAAHFGYPDGGPRGRGAYPATRMVALMALRSHILVSAAFGPYLTSEQELAEHLWPCVPDHSLSIVDKNFFGANILIPLNRGGVDRHWLVRARKNLRWRVVEHFSADDMLVEMEVSSEARARDPGLPKTWTARAIRYQRKGFQPELLLTSMVDAVRFPAVEIAALYHERWELELGYDEIKTEMLDHEESLRSKTPDAVTQELWGILLAYNLVRLEMERVADEARVEPSRISFVAAFRLIVDEWLWLAVTSPGAIPSRLRDLRANLKRLILPARRSERSYPRAVKIKLSPYPRNRRSSSEGKPK